MIGGTFEVAYWLLDWGFALCLMMLGGILVFFPIAIALGFIISVIDDVKRRDGDRKNK